MIRNLLIITTLFSSLFFQTSQAALSSTEQQMQAYIIQQQPAALTLLEKLVNINSGTTNLKGVRKVGDIVRLQLNGLGFKTTWVKAPTDLNRAGALVAERNGTQGKKFLLIGHLDTVFPASSPFQRFSRDNNIAKGPGVIDAKGGIVVMLSALQALQSVDALKDANITIVLTGDEEDTGKPNSLARQFLLDVAQRSDVALDFEWASSKDTAIVSRRGISSWTLQTTGSEGHSADIFQESVGDGAIFALARILNGMRVELAGEKYLSFNPGIVLGGTTLKYDDNTSQGSAFGEKNVVAKAGFAKGDLRYLTVQQLEATKKQMLWIAENQHLSGTSATLDFEDIVPSMPPSDGNLQMLKDYSQVSVDLGGSKIKSLDPEQRGSADISYVATIIPNNLSGLGPVGDGAHSVNESLDIDSLAVQAQRAAILIYRLTR